MDDDVVRSVVLPKLQQVRKQGGYWTARCPAHEDDRASLSVAAGDTQPVLLKCFAGCERDDILKAIGLSWADICKPRDSQQLKGVWTPRGDAVAVYDYVDEQGELLYQVCRTADKEFPVRVPDRSRKSGYRWSLAGVRRVLYRLPKIIDAITDGEIIYIVEGEKDVQALEAAGAIATCPPGGSNESVWLTEYTPFFEGSCVRIVADKDKPGWAHAHRVFDALSPVAAAVEIVEAAAGKDAADHLAAGLALADFLMTKQAGADDPPILAPDLYQFIGMEEPPIDWLIRGIIERGDRLIWTGPEGFGKSTVGRQLATAGAAGLHPFDGTAFKPVNVLVVDCENPLRMSISAWRNMERVARGKGRPVPEHGLHIIRRPEGIDLVKGDDAEWLAERVRAHAPDLVIIGPLYKMHAMDANEELAARAITNVLDHIRVNAECGLIVEAHSPHGGELRPIGSSLFKRWPEFGYGMRPEKDDSGQLSRRTGRICSWRGPRDERDGWPGLIKWGEKGRDWPWIPADDDDSHGAAQGQWWQNKEDG